MNRFTMASKVSTRASKMTRELNKVKTLYNAAIMAYVRHKICLDQDDINDLPIELQRDIWKAWSEYLTQKIYCWEFMRTSPPVISRVEGEEPIYMEMGVPARQYAAVAEPSVSGSRESSV